MDGTDEALVVAFVAGDAAAFDELVQRHRRRVYAICLRYFRDASEAEDAMQETFVVLLRRASTYRGGAAFSTWLYRVTTNVCHDLARRRSRRPQPVDGEVHEVADTTDAIANRELAVELEQALARLEPDQRRAVVLHDVLGLPYADVAEREGIALGTVKSRIARGHARLADLLDGRPSTSTAMEPSSPPNPPTVTP